MRSLLLIFVLVFIFGCQDASVSIPKSNYISNNETYQLYVYSSFGSRIDIVEYDEEFFDGMFLPSKNYTIKVSKDGFKTATIDINLNQNLKLRVNLEKLNSSSKSTISIFALDASNEEKLKNNENLTYNNNTSSEFNFKSQKSENNKIILSSSINLDEDFKKYIFFNVFFDKDTNLIWQNEPFTKQDKINYDNGREDGRVWNFENAKKYCKNLKLAGFTDWRLPNEEELESIYSKNKNKNSKGYNYFIKKEMIENLPPLNDYYSSMYFWSQNETNSSLNRNIFFVGRNTYRIRSTGESYVLCVKKIDFKNLKNNNITIKSNGKISIKNMQLTEKNFFNIKQILENKKKSIKEKLTIITNHIIENETESLNKSLVKDEFETTQQFEDRKKAKEQELKLKVKETLPKAINIALASVYGGVYIKELNYNADKGSFFAKLTSTNNNFNKNLTVPMNISIAREFKEDMQSLQPKVIFDYKNSELNIKEIKIEYKNREYLANITNEEYENTPIKVALDIDTKRDINIDTTNTTNNLTSMLESLAQFPINKNAYAIVIGIDKYDYTSRVEFADSSAKMFSKFLHKAFGVANENIKLLINEDATSGKIKSEIATTLSLLDKDSILYFYYAGHGVPYQNRVYLLSNDLSPKIIDSEKGLLLEGIYEKFSKSNAKKVISFVDSCFSGLDDNGEQLIEGIAPATGEFNILRENFDENKMLFFSAGGSTEFANYYKEKNQRLFSYFLMEALAKGYFDTKSLKSYVVNNVKRESSKIGGVHLQIPRLKGEISNLR